MNKYSGLVKGILMVGQFGFMLVTPPLCLAFFAGWLMKKFNLGIWIMIFGLIIGFLTAASTAVDFFRSNSKKADEASKNAPLSYRNHL